MTCIYSISFNLGIRIIPITTHYAYDIYPAKTITPKTQAGFAPKPMIQRKAVKDERPLRPTEKIILGPIVAAPKPRHKFRKDINKEALAEYFDNDVLPSRAEIAQEKLDTWLIQTAIELENANIEKTNQNVTEEEIRKFVEGKKTVVTYRFQDENTTDNKGVEEDTYNNPWAEIAAYAHDLDWKESFERRFFANEVNCQIADCFTRKYADADTAAAMRALDKAKRNNKYISRKIQRTK